jgi:heme-degrading monooxygenase HmoA
MTDVQNYSGGDWHVRAGSADAFVARWTEFLEWTRASAPGLVSARLVRDANEPSHFISFAEWESLPSVTAWMELPDFDAKFDACSALCEQARGSHFTLTAVVR